VQQRDWDLKMVRILGGGVKGNGEGVRMLK